MFIITILLTTGSNDGVYGTNFKQDQYTSNFIEHAQSFRMVSLLFPSVTRYMRGSKVKTKLLKSLWYFLTFRRAFVSVLDLFNLVYFIQHFRSKRKFCHLTNSNATYTYNYMQYTRFGEKFLVPLSESPTCSSNIQQSTVHNEFLLNKIRKN